MSLTAEGITGDEREALKADATQTLVRLTIQEKIVERDIDRDPAARAELDSLRSERESAEATLTEILAHERADRRVADAAAAASAEARRTALDRARELAGERAKAAQAVDAALQKFATALAEHDRVSREQYSALQRAGEGRLADIAMTKAWRTNGATRHALRAASVRDGAIELPLYPSMPIKPFSELDPRAIEPGAKS